MRQKKHNLPLYPSGLFVEHAQKSILVFISEITSGAQSVVLWRGMKKTWEELAYYKLSVDKIRKEKKKKSIHLPTELIRVLVIISMKINQKKAKLPFGIIKCLWETKDHKLWLMTVPQTFN